MFKILTSSFSRVHHVHDVKFFKQEINHSFRVPRTIVPDNSNHFISAVMKDVMRTFSGHRKTVALYAPMYDFIAEIMVVSINKPFHSTSCSGSVKWIQSILQTFSDTTAVAFLEYSLYFSSYRGPLGLISHYYLSIEKSDQAGDPEDPPLGDPIYQPSRRLYIIYHINLALQRFISQSEPRKMVGERHCDVSDWGLMAKGRALVTLKMLAF